MPITAGGFMGVNPELSNIGKSMLSGAAHGLLNSNLAYRLFKFTNGGSNSIAGSMLENATGITEDELMQYLQDTLNSSAEQAELNRAFNSAEAELARKFQAIENQKNRDFTERMANTSYVRAVKDLQKAGLNPILAYQQGGASSPSSASSVTSSQASYSVGSGDSISDVVNALANLVSSTTGLGSLIRALK